jgi:hypothetical protein
MSIKIYCCIFNLFRKIFIYFPESLYYHVHSFLSKELENDPSNVAPGC